MWNNKGRVIKGGISFFLCIINGSVYVYVAVCQSSLFFISITGNEEEEDDLLKS
jgi:hypothetical protein